MDDSTILLIEDDPGFAAEFAEYLRRYAFSVEHAATLDAAFEMFAKRSPDVVILDQFLGRIDALEAMPEIRDRYAGPLMVLTGNVDIADRIKGLEIGADDFVSKTTPPREILARLRALSRRAKEWTAPTTEAAPTAGLDLLRRVAVTAEGHAIELTSAEFETLRLLVERIGVPVGRDDLSQAVLKRPFMPNDRAVDNIVAHLRQKLEPFGRGPGIIVGVRNIGYCFTGFGHESGWADAAAPQ